MKILRCILPLLLFAVVALPSICGLHAQTSPNTAQTTADFALWGTAVNGLQISLSLGSPTIPGHIPAITLGLRNVGSVVLKVLLGIHCGPGPVGTNNVVLVDLMDGGNSIRLRYHEVGGCAGAAAANIVTLPPGAESSVPIDLNYYDPAWVPGRAYHLRAELTNPESGWTPSAFWPGQITSNRLEIRFPAQ